MPSTQAPLPDSPDDDTTLEARSSRRQAKDEYVYLLRPDEQSAGSDESQPWLFPQADLVVPDGVLRMRKAVAAIHAVPIGGNESLSLNTRRIFDALILAAQMDIRGRGPDMMDRIKKERVSPYFEVRITELVRLAGIKGKNYKRIYEDLDEIFDMRLNWNVVAEDATIEWAMRAHFLATYGRGTGRNSGVIRFSIDPAILEIVLDPANWATLSLQVLRGMPTMASYQLYQNVWRYINTAQKVTAALPVETWIELILGPSRFVKVDAQTKKKIAVDYGDFKRRYLTDAIDRVNSTAALDHTIELKETRSGNRVAKLQFKFHRKTQQRLELPVAWDQVLIDRLRVFGFSQQDLAELSQVHSADRMTEALLRMASAKERLAKRGEKIGSPNAFLRGILDRMTGAEHAEELVPVAEDAAERERLLERERAEAAKASLLAETFGTYSREAFREAMHQAAPELVQRCREQFAGSEKGRVNKFILERYGWDTPAMLVALSSWLRDEEPQLYQSLVPNPEARDFEAWLKAQGRDQA
jgi:hypothetical protein